MKFKAEIKIDATKEDKDILLKAILPDIKNNKRINIEIKDDKIVINGEDITALRAGLDSICRLIKTADNILKMGD